MEKEETIIYGYESMDRIKEHLEQSPEMQRYMFFSRKIYEMGVGSKAETDTHIYWSYQVKKPRFENGKLFFTSHTKQGATYDKAKKTIKIWFDMQFRELIPDIQNNIADTFKFDWYYTSMSTSMKSILTNGLLNRVIKGKITNPRDLVKAFLKVGSYRTIDISPETFFKFFNREHAPSPMYVRRQLEYATNAELYLQDRNEHDYMYEDLFNQAAMLNEKVNPAWSQKRRHEVHTEWTRRIMELSIKEIKPYLYNYDMDSISLPSGISIIQSNLELFQEGTEMKHCVYTNYEYRVKWKNYFVLQYNRNGVRATVGISLSDRYTSDDSEPFIEQMYSFANSAVDQEHKDYVENWLATDSVSKWFKKELEKEKTQQKCEELI